MKNIVDYINENRTIIEKFSKATVVAIKNNISDANIEFDIKGHDFTDCGFYKKGGDSYFKYNCKSLDGNFSDDNLIFIYDNKIYLADIELSNKSSYNSPCKLASTEYDKKTNKTCLEYKVDGLRANRGFDWLRGTIKLYIPTDIINVSEIYNIDCKSYDKFMEDYLLKKVEYHNTKIDREDIKFWESKIIKNELHIILELQTGKGYSTNYREKTYNFTWSDHYYKCDKKLYDKDYEAQIIRKFISGLEEFVKTKSKLPEKVHILVSQYLE